MLKLNLVFNSDVNLKIRAWSPKPNQGFIMPEGYIHATLVPSRQLLHEISCILESVTPTLPPPQTGSAPKNICNSPSSSVLGHKNGTIWALLNLPAICQQEISCKIITIKVTGALKIGYRQWVTVHDELILS